jgi:hypothetical protein
MIPPNMHCPKCGSPRVHRSHRRSGLERALCAIGAEVRRCHDCRARQAWLRSRAIRLPAEAASPGQLTNTALLGSSFIACLLLIWWMISRFTELTG